MATRVEEIRRTFGLGDALQGLLIVDPSEAFGDQQLRGQAHYIRRAFDQMRLDAVICIDRIPTIFLKKYSRPVSRPEVNELQHTFWNQGAGTILVILDSVRLYVFSSMVPPSTDDGPVEDHDALVEPLELVSNVLESCQLITRVATGRYYREHRRKFDAQNTVDQHLLNDLAAVGNELKRSDDVDERRRVHGFLGRIIFTAYLIDRHVIELQDYSFVRKAGVESLLDVLTEYEPLRAKDVLYDIFDRLRVDFNGSIFETDLDAEKDTITDDDLNTLARFLRGEIESRQTSFGFWAYDFASIPVETISAIYEKFLEEEDAEQKGQQGAFYTPRYLAEMVVDEATAEFDSLLDLRCLDPACGSGIFLVIFFNRIAEEYQYNNPRAHTQTRLNHLLDVLENQICGIDINRTACRIACFSLYIAFLDQFDSLTLKELQQRSKKILPNLLEYHDGPKNRKLKLGGIYEGNFFDPDMVKRIGDQFDVVVGNPPWVGRNQVSDQAASDWVESKEDNPYLKDGPTRRADRKAVFFPQDQIANAFMWKTPVHAKDLGRICLLLPVHVLLCATTDKFQRLWFSRMRVNRIYNLSDFRLFLFQDAKRPALIAQFQRLSAGDDNSARDQDEKATENAETTVPTHRIEYVVPKVRQQDPRSGLIRVFPSDRKWFDNVDVLRATFTDHRGDGFGIGGAVFWKAMQWGSARDVAFVEYLSSLERLGDIAGEERENKRWLKGVGFQPWYEASAQASQRNYGEKKPIPGKLDDAFLGTLDSIQMFVVEADTQSLRSHLESSTRRRGDYHGPEEHLKAALDGFRRASKARLFSSPVVVVSKGFTKFAFCGFPTFFEDSLTGIAGLPSDEDLLRFFTVYVKSNLAKYFIFHTASNLGAERDQVFVHELMRLPFPLPDSPNSHKDAENIVAKVAARMKELQQQITQEYNAAAQHDDFQLRSASLIESRLQRVDELQEQLEPLVYRYFKLTENEIRYVNDTCDVFKKSATPSSAETQTVAIKPTNKKHRNAYGDLLCQTLNGWAEKDQPRGKNPPFYFSAETRVFPEVQLTLVTLKQSATRERTCDVSANGQLQSVIDRLVSGSSYKQGSFEFLRGVIIADQKRIHILKQDMLGQWTRTDALNDADEIFHAIVQSTRNR